MVNLDELFPIRPYRPDSQLPPTHWWLKPWLMAGKINFVFGPEKSGKSRLLAWLLASWFVKKSTLPAELYEGPKRIMYLAGEELPEEVEARLRQYIKLLGGDPATPLPIVFISASGMRLELPHYRHWLESKMHQHECDCLLIDPLRRVHQGDENSNNDMALLSNELRRWTNNNGWTAVIVHHTGKLNEFADPNRIATWSRGCTDLATVLDLAVFITPVGNPGANGRSLRVLRAGRFRPVPPLLITDLTDRRGFWPRQ